MAKKFEVNKEKCLGCGVCTVNCPGGVEMDTDGKAKVIDSERVEQSGGADVCPHGVIEQKEEGGTK
jgi:ferredoxin